MVMVIVWIYGMVYIYVNVVEWVYINVWMCRLAIFQLFIWTDPFPFPCPSTSISIWYATSNATTIPLYIISLSLSSYHAITTYYITNIVIVMLIVVVWQRQIQSNQMKSLFGVLLACTLFSTQLNIISYEVTIPYPHMAYITPHHSFLCYHQLVQAYSIGSHTMQHVRVNWCGDSVDSVLWLVQVRFGFTVYRLIYEGWGFTRPY